MRYSYDMTEYEIFPTEHLSSLQSVQSGGLETALARPLLSSWSLLVPPILQNTEIHCSGQARPPPAALGWAQPSPVPASKITKKLFGEIIYFTAKEKYRKSWDLPADSFLS